MSKKLSPVEIRDRKVLRALDRGLSYRQIETKIGVPKSTAFDISVRYGATSVNVAY